MISRRTAENIARAYESQSSEMLYSHLRKGRISINGIPLYDYLYVNEYPTWFCNLATSLQIRGLRAFVMGLHTGESLERSTPQWDLHDRQRLGQELLRNLAKDILNLLYSSALSTHLIKRWLATPIRTRLIRNLELDGYIYRDSKLILSETDVVDAGEQAGVLERLYSEVKLNNLEVAFHHLRLSEEHYLQGRWDDSISNSRKFLECVLREVASAHSVRVTGAAIPPRTYTTPAGIREYLEKQGLLESKERETLSSVYGLLSQTGSHPYIAQNEQARLMRYLAFMLAQFVMLKYQGRLSVLKRARRKRK